MSMSNANERLYEADKKQIESIARVDIARGRGFQPNVTDRYPRTFEGVDARLARVYYKVVWKGLTENGKDVR